MLSWRHWNLMGLAVCLISAAGCGGGSTSTTSTSGASRVRFLNAVPKSVTVDITIDGVKVVKSLAYAQAASAGYTALASGSHKIQISITNANPPVVSTDTLFVSANTDNTLLAVGRSDNGSMHALMVQDDNSAPIANFAKLRVVDASPDSATTLDTFITSPQANITSLVPTRNLSYGTATDYVDVAAGAQQIRLSSSGTTNAVFDSGALSIAAGQIRTLVVIDSSDGLGFTTVLLNDKN